MTYEFIPVTTIEDAQIMRKIRNECKRYMTRNTDFITKEQQVEWFSQINHDDIKMYLMKYQDEIIGYGYCRREGNEVMLTGGLKGCHRNRGHGKILFNHLIAAAEDFGLRITLEVLNTNERARYLYDSLGFDPISTDGRITKMEI